MPRILKAKHATTGLNISRAGYKPGEKLYDWHQQQEGKTIRNRRCPHWGAKMVMDNGLLRCPLHDLHGCPKTNKIVKHPNAVNEN